MCVSGCLCLCVQLRKRVLLPPFSLLGPPADSLGSARLLSVLGSLWGGVVFLASPFLA